VAVGPDGSVYVTHNVSSGKVVRKLDSSGNEIWAKTDVGGGRGVAVGPDGSVYVTHDVPSGNKALRKLDPRLYYQIVG